MEARRLREWEARLHIMGSARRYVRMEGGYLFFVGVVTLMAFVPTTMLTYEQVAWMYGLQPWIRLALILFVGVKLARERTWHPTEIALAVILCGVLLRTWQRVPREYVHVPELVLLIAGAHEVDFKKIAKVWFGVCAAALLITVTLALTGVIENLVYDTERGTRIAFGSIYPTDFSCHVFFLAAAWAWIRERRITFWEIAVIAALGGFCLVFCVARNNAGCLFLLAAGLLYLRLRRRESGRSGRDYVPAKPVRAILPFVAPILAAVMILLSAVYSKESGWMKLLNSALSYRLSKGRTAFANYAVNLFGQEVEMNGYGGSTDAAGNHFFLDSSYMNLLFCFGLVTLLCLLGVMVICAVREKRLGAWERLGILAIVALQCMTEHHMIELSYNLFLLLPLAASGLPAPRLVDSSDGAQAFP